MSQWLGVDDDAALALIVEFNDTEHFGALEPVEDAVEILFELMQEHTLHVVTACSTEPGVVFRRRANLALHYGPIFKSILCLDLGQSKDDALRAFEPGIWVEDNYRHAVAGVEAGHRTFLRRRPHNLDKEADSHPAITWFTHWDEVIAHI